MSIYLLPTQPRVGQEIRNASAIAEVLQNLGDREAHLYIVSNSAIMGLGTKHYAKMSDFKDRQRKALERLQTTIPKQATLICAEWDEQKGQYYPLSLSYSRISRIEGAYIHKTSSHDFPIAFSCSSKEPFPADVPVDLCILMEEFPFETYASIPTQVSLSRRQSLTAKNMEMALSSCFSESPVPKMTVPVYGQYQGLFWDGSFGYELSNRAIRFSNSPAYQVVEFDPSTQTFQGGKEESRLIIEQIFLKLCEHIRMYTTSVGAKGVVIALSGGIDSSLVATLATFALGPKQVFGVLLPGPFSSSHSVSDAKELCENLGISYKIHSISSLYEETQRVLEMDLHSLSLENLQARLRGVLLMSYSNQKGYLALNTCNKSEDMVGYSTLYGDAVGAFAPLGDLYKTEVYELSRYINMRYQKMLIPSHILEKEPSAELRDGQKDTDSLPSYDKLDIFLQAAIEYGGDIEMISKDLGLSEDIWKDLLQKVFSSQYKRKQSPRVLSIGEKRRSELRDHWSESEVW